MSSSRRQGMAAENPDWRRRRRNGYPAHRNEGVVGCVRLRRLVALRIYAWLSLQGRLPEAARRMRGR